MILKKRVLPLTLPLILCMASSCKTLSVESYAIKTPLIEKGDTVKIILLSDLHSTIFGKNQSPLIEMVKEQNPDLILLTGDIIDDKVPNLGTELLLSGINGIAPMYYVTGNHEYRTRNIEKVRELIRSYNVSILSDAYVKIDVRNNEIVLAGIDDPDKRYYETPEYDQAASMENAFRELDGVKSYKILIAHRPENIETYRKYSFDLVLSGHTHGGQVRIPHILNGLIAPNQGFFPKYGGGLYKHENLTHIISRGLSVNPLLPRIFNPPELVVVILKSSGS